MKREGMSDKELKLLAAARREAAAARGNAVPSAKPAPPGPPSARAPTASPLDARTVVGWIAAPAGATPLDQPTVAGWDHPAARDTSAQGADGKWSRIAALMESERAAANERRRRAKRTGTVFLGVLLLLVALVAARILLSR